MTVDPATTPTGEQVVMDAPRRLRWHQKLSSMLLVIFCLEIGTFLLMFPWFGAIWGNNYFSSLLHRGFWENAYFRGAVSGLGVLNLYVSFAEILRLRRFW